MPASYDVTLPRSVTPRFPDRCPCSGQANPGKAVRLSFIGYAGTPRLVDAALIGTTAAGGNTIDYVVVPASEDCARRLRRYHFWIKVFKYGTWAPLTFGALFLIGNTAVCIVAALGGLLVPVLWEITHPPAVGATPKPDSITYEFAARDYAEEFARLNNTTLDGTSKEAAKPAA